MATPTESILQDSKEVIYFAHCLSYNLPKKSYDTSLLGCTARTACDCVLWFIQPQEMEASRNEGTESSYLSFTKSSCLQLPGPSNTHRGLRLPLLSEGGGGGRWSYERSRPWRRASSLALWGGMQRCVRSSWWGALLVVRIGLSKQETIPRWKGVLTPFFPHSWDYEPLSFLTGNTEGPVSVCFLKTLQLGNFHLQTNRIYTKRFANTTCSVFGPHRAYFRIKRHINLGVNCLKAMITAY